MDAKDLFSLMDKCKNHSFSGIVEWYWLLEMAIADENEACYSNLEEYADPDNRKCQLCGAVCQTTDFGLMPRECSNKQCEALRKYWGVLGFPRFSQLATTGKTASRSQYLKARIQKTFGCNRMSAIPFELRFDFMLSTMIERIAHESNN